MVDGRHIALDLAAHAGWPIKKWRMAGPGPLGLFAFGFTTAFQQVRA